MLFSDGENAILTDGFFTRPPAHKILLGKIAPNKETIQQCLNLAGVKKLDAVIPLHSHFDHAMDAPMVADLTGAQLIGSSSTINIGKGYGLNESQMTIPSLNEGIEIGKFKLTFIESRHWQYPSAKQRAELLDQDVVTPIVTPAKMADYKEGISYTLFIEHDSTKIAIQGSAGFKDNSISNQNVDLLFVAVSGLELMDEEYNNQYQKLLIDPLHPKVLVPIHFDDFTVPLTKGLKPTSLLFNLKFGTSLDKAFEILSANNPDKEIRVLPLWDKVSIQKLSEK